MPGSTERCCRLETYRYALYTKFQEPKLFRLAVKGDWDLIPDRARNHPKEASFVHRYAPMDTALHRILRPTATAATATTTNLSRTDRIYVDVETQQEIKLLKLNAVASLLEAFPPAVLIQDSFGKTPLHLACMDLSNGGLEAATMIMDSLQDGTGACAPDLEGRTPLHYLVARCNDVELPPTELWHKLVGLRPTALFERDAVGQTPVEILESRRDEWALADELRKELIALQQRGAVSPNQNQRNDTVAT